MKEFAPDEITALLLNCLHRDVGRAPMDRLKRLTLDQWQSLVSRAAQHQVRGLLYHRFKSRGLELAIPGEILHTMKQSYHQIAASNLLALDELRQITMAFHSKNIPVVILKGAYLTERVYKNLGAREMRDIDLLVPADRVAQAAGIVEGMGHAPLYPYAVDTELESVRHLPRFVKPQVVGVELHWNITTPNLHYSIDPKELWERAIPTRIAGVDSFGLCPEDLLLHLCFHVSYQHLFEFALRPFCDIVETISQFGPRLRWERVIERARRWRWERGVYLALELARELLGATVPDVVLAYADAPAYDENLIAIAGTQTLSDRSVTNALPSSLVRITHSPTLHARTGALLKSLFLPTAQLARQYAIAPDSPKLYLFYPIHWVDLVRKYARLALDLFRGKSAVTLIAKRKLILENWLAEA